MILSILVPTYNYNARALVSDLCRQINHEGVDAEIVVGDDASTQHTEWLDEISVWPLVRVLRYADNAGRARHRNRMADVAKGEWLLFVDCDAQLETDFSLQRYLDKAAEAHVICGGLRHPEVNPLPEATLRYTYERAADRHRSAKERQRKPYSHLSTFNLMVRSDVFRQVRFDERCKEYGYEDALFGVELARRMIPILHIDNPLVHMGLEPNDVYLEKTETALRSLKRLQDRMRGYSHVATVALRLQQCHLAWFMRAFYKAFRNPMRRNLLGTQPNLKIFSLYKLGYLMNCK